MPGFDSVGLFSTLLGRKLVRYLVDRCVVGDEGERGQSQVSDGFDQNTVVTMNNNEKVKR